MSLEVDIGWHDIMMVQIRPIGENKFDSIWYGLFCKMKVLLGKLYFQLYKLFSKYSNSITTKILFYNLGIEIIYTLYDVNPFSVE